MTAEPLAVEPPQDAPAPRPVARPILPDWAHSRTTILATVRDRARYHTRNSARHLLRVVLLVYWWRIVRRAPWGFARITARTYRWVMDAPGTTMRTSIATNTGKEAADGKVFVELTRQHRQTVSGRLFVIVLALAGLAFLCYVNLRDFWLIVGVTNAALLLLGLIGKTADHPILDRFADSDEAPRFDCALILEALAALSIPALTRGIATVKFPDPPHRDGKGWRTSIELPSGVTAAEVVAKREKLASGLKRHITAVWPRTDPSSHPGRLILWCAYAPMNMAEPVPWAHAKASRLNIFDKVHLGQDPQGEPVYVNLMFASILLGGMSRMGKTGTLRELLCAAALDPRVELHIYEPKGLDFRSFKTVAHRHIAGRSDADTAAIVDDLKSIDVEMERRYALMTLLPADECPEGQVTDELANRRELHPIWVALDEAQIPFEHPTYGREIAELLTRLVQLGPAAGFTTIITTQKPGVDCIPTRISANALLRIAHKVETDSHNDQILGAGMYRNGWRATEFSRDDKGFAIVKGEGSAPLIVRVAKIDIPASNEILARARVTRQRAGLLTGHANGEEDPQDAESQDSILEHLAAVMPEKKVHSVVLAARLVHRFPDIYPEGMTAADVTNAVKPYGLQSRQMKAGEEGRNLNGLVRAELTAALAGREAAREAVVEPQDSALPDSEQVDTPLPAPLPGSEHETTL